MRSQHGRLIVSQALLVVPVKANVARYSTGCLALLTEQCQSTFSNYLYRLISETIEEISKVPHHFNQTNSGRATSGDCRPHTGFRRFSAFSFLQSSQSSLASQSPAHQHVFTCGNEESGSEMTRKLRTFSVFDPGYD